MIRSARRRAAAVLLLLVLVVSSGCGEGPASGDVEVRLAVPVWEVVEHPLAPPRGHRDELEVPYILRYRIER